jgi:hypothetical protein
MCHSSMTQIKDTNIKDNLFIIDTLNHGLFIANNTTNCKILFSYYFYFHYYFKLLFNKKKKEVKTKTIYLFIYLFQATQPLGSNL